MLIYGMSQSSEDVQVHNEMRFGFRFYEQYPNHQSSDRIDPAEKDSTQINYNIKIFIYYLSFVKVI